MLSISIVRSLDFFFLSAFCPQLTDLILFLTTDLSIATNSTLLNNLRLLIKTPQPTWYQSCKGGLTKNCNKKEEA